MINSVESYIFYFNTMYFDRMCFDEVYLSQLLDLTTY